MSIEKYGFFDSTSDDVREYSGADWLRFSRLVSPNGVRSESDLAISAAETGLKIRAGYGLAMVDGQQYELYDDGSGAKELQLTAASGSARIDRIVLRLDRNTRTITMMVKRGGPDAPALTRTDTVYELSLAQVRVAVGAEKIGATDVTDERGVKTLCGILQGLTAGEAYTLAQSAQTAADAAQSTAQTAQQTAQSAQSAAQNAQKTAEGANAKATGAFYKRTDPAVLNVTPEGWMQDEENDRVYQDFAAEGVTPEMLPMAASEKIGPAFPLCGCATGDGSIRLYMSQEPTVSDSVIVHLMGVRG